MVCRSSFCSLYYVLQHVKAKYVYPRLVREHNTATVQHPAASMPLAPWNTDAAMLWGHLTTLKPFIYSLATLLSLGESAHVFLVFHLLSATLSFIRSHPNSKSGTSRSGIFLVSTHDPIKCLTVPSDTEEVVLHFPHTLLFHQYSRPHCSFLNNHVSLKTHS